MIIEYHRPLSLDEALRLLLRDEPHTVPLGGGTTLSQGTSEPVAVVDLQGLNLKSIAKDGNILKIGAAVTLEALRQSALAPLPITQAILRQGTLNIRNQATVGGTVVSCSGRSVLVTVLLAADARMRWEPDGIDLSLGEWLLNRQEYSRGKLLTEISIPINNQLCWDAVSRTPRDFPLVCVAAATWPSGRCRLALGGVGNAPILAMDGSEKDGAEMAAENAFSSATDAFASAEYRCHAARILVKRLLPSGINL